MCRSVVIVDDDSTFLALAARILTDLGVEVLATAADAAQGLVHVHNSRPEAVLVDVGLPDRYGIDLAFELLELPWGPTVVLTSSDPDALFALEACDHARMPPFIAKEHLAGDALRQALTPA